MTAGAAYDNPEAYIAGDRRRALATGTELPDRVHGAALFADISGFTPLTEALVAEYGPRRGGRGAERCPGSAVRRPAGPPARPRRQCRLLRWRFRHLLAGRRRRQPGHRLRPGHADRDDQRRIDQVAVRGLGEARDEGRDRCRAGLGGQLSPLLDGAERVPVLLHLVAVLELTGEWVKAEATYLDALALAERIDDQRGAYRVRKALAEVARKQGRHEEAGALLDLAQAGFARLGDQVGVGEVLHLAGTLAAQQGDYGLARERYHASLEIRRELDDAEGMGACSATWRSSRSTRAISTRRGN